MEHPKIIQGGMGAGVSNWQLAHIVSANGALGVVSGVALDAVLARRLEQGDQGGHMRRGLAAFPDQKLANRILEKYFRPDGTNDTHDFSMIPLPSAIRESEEGDSCSRNCDELTVAANFVEIFLAKEGHAGVVGINYLAKIPLSNPAAIYGAMLAGVDYVLMGAGIPLEIPGLLDAYARGESGSVRVPVEGAAKDENFVVRFNPAHIIESPPTSMKRPYFLSIVSSYILAATMATRSTGRVDGIIVENNTAGGHNAPPRGVLSLDANGEPIYGLKDTVDYAKMVGLNIPFWLGGSCSMPESLEESKAEGAIGIQVGTLFAFCRESGILPELKKRFLEAVAAGKAFVFTHPTASPTGYPFKIALLRDTVSDSLEFLKRKRVCNLGFLRELFKTEQGTVGYRCPAEAESVFVKKGGLAERTKEARCLCNSLLSNIGQGMKYAGGYLEKPLVTVGSHLESLKLLISKFGTEYSAKDVIRFLESGSHKGVRS